MKNKIVFGGAFFVFISSFSSAYAIMANVTGTATNLQQRVEERQEIRKNIEESRASEAARIMARRQELREEFRLKLQAIHDERKKALAERIETRMNEINAKRTEEMTKHLEKMEEILTRIEEKGNQSNLENQDELKNAVASARAAIEAAKTTVQAQAEKTYTPQVTTEANLRINVGQTVSQLTADLRATRESVIAAKKVLMDAAAVLIRARESVTVTPAASPSGGQ